MSSLSLSTTSSESSDDDLTLDEVISANPPMLQPPNYQPFPLSSRATRILVQRVPNPQGNLLPTQNLYLPRPAINQQPQWNAIQNQNVPPGVQRVPNPQGNLLPPHNLRLPRPVINQQPQRNVVQNQNVPLGQMAEGDASQDIQPSQIDGPIVNGLYDPNFAAIGLPVDPFLRMFMLNPGFGNVPKRK